MDLATIGWILAGWTLVAIVVSLVTGRMFQHASTAEAELDQAVSNKQVVRYLRQTRDRKAGKARAASGRSVAL